MQDTITAAKARALAVGAHHSLSPLHIAADVAIIATLAGTAGLLILGVTLAVIIVVLVLS